MSRNGNVRPTGAKIQIYIFPSALRAMYEPAKKCAFHPDGDEDEEDEEEGEFGRDDVPVCYSPPAGKVKQTALPNTIFLPSPLWQYITLVHLAFPAGVLDSKGRFTGTGTLMTPKYTYILVA